ncbi:MAG TPA: DUF5681 domain-containing protein [Pyrinomonadaceae bacterium]
MQGNNREVGYGRPPVHTRFKKGRSGNPKGRPRSAAISDAVRAVLAESPPGGEGADVESYADAIARALIDKTIAGDVAVIKEVCDLTEGKARHAVVLTYTEREVYELAVREMMDESQCTREEAVRTLGVFRPDALALLDEC